MVFDIIFLIVLLVAISLGYRRGLVSMILSLGAVAVSIVLAMYITYKWPLINYPVFGYWLQTFILFVVFNIIINRIIALLNFEGIVLVGFVSRLLGAALYGLIFALVVFFVVLALFTVAPNFLSTQFPNSVVLSWIHDFWQKIHTIGGLQTIQQGVQQGREILGV